MGSQLKKEIQESKQPAPKGRRWRKGSKNRRAHSGRKNGKTAYDPRARPIEDVIAEIAGAVSSLSSQVVNTATLKSAV